VEPIETREQWAAIRTSGIGYIYNDSPPNPEAEAAPGILHTADCRSLERASRTSHRWKLHFQDLADAEAWLSKNRGSEAKDWRRCSICTPNSSRGVASAAVARLRPTELSIRIAPRFADRFAAASASLQRLAYGEIHTFVRRYRADPNRIAAQYDRLEHLKPERVLELELGGGPRALGLWRPPVFTLLDIGEHGIVGKYPRSMLPVQERMAQEADRNFWPDSALISGFFISNPDRRITQLGMRRTQSGCTSSQTSRAASLRPWSERPSARR
jgi:hypothetical protein